MSLRCDYLWPVNLPGPAGNVGAPYSFDVSVAKGELRYDVRAYSTVNIQAVFSVGTVAAVLTVYRSLDGYNLFALETAQTLGPASALTTTIDTSGTAYLVLRTTTSEATRNAALLVLGKASS